MPGGQGMAGTGAIVRRTIAHLILASGRSIVRLGLIRGIRVIVRLRIRGRRGMGMGIRGLVRLGTETGTQGHGLRGMGILVLDLRGMGAGIRVLGLRGVGMGILGLGLRGMGMGILGLGLRGMGTSRVFNRRGPAIQALGLRHSQSLLHRLGLLTRVEVIRGRAAVRGRVAAGRDRSPEVGNRDPVAVEAVRSRARRAVTVEGAEM